MSGAELGWLGASTAALAGAVLLIGIRQFAARRPDYSQLRHTISELGEMGARDRKAVAWLFAGVGLLLLVGAALNGVAQPSSWPALAVSAGYLIAAVFPCDPGSPLSGSMRQGVHNFGGGIEYVGGGLALLALDDGGLYTLTGALALFTAGVLSLPVLAAARGVIQRVGEAALFLGSVSALAGV